MVLPIKRAIIVIVSRPLNNFITLCPFRKASKAFWLNGNVIIHEPKPLGPKFVSGFHAGRKAAGAAQVFLLRTIYNATLPATSIRGRQPPQRIGFPLENMHNICGGLGILIIDDHDAPWRHRGLQIRIKKLAEQFLTFESHHNNGNVFHVFPPLEARPLLFEN